jgi:tetratricopeptide (TPR) repeat protein
VRACVRTGYDVLTAGGGSAQLAARAFRALGLLHVPDVAPWVVAAMLAEPDVEIARTALDRLVDAQLLEPVAGGRYRLHDLVRLVASERAADEDTLADRDEVVYRAIAFYTGALQRVEEGLQQFQSWPLRPPPTPSEIALPGLGEPTRARRWLDHELPNLVAALEQAVALEGDTWQLTQWLARALWSRLEVRCEWLTTHRVSWLVLEAARRRNDAELAACGLLMHGRSEANLGRYGLATSYLERALAAWNDLNNDVGVGWTLNGLGVVDSRRRWPAAALVSYTKALDFARRHNFGVHFEATILSNMCASYALLGQLDRAVVAGRDSVDICAADDLPPCQPAL